MLISEELFLNLVFVDIRYDISLACYLLFHLNVDIIYWAEDSQIVPWQRNRKGICLILVTGFLKLISNKCCVVGAWPRYIHQWCQDLSGGYCVPSEKPSSSTQNCDRIMSSSEVDNLTLFRDGSAPDNTWPRSLSNSSKTYYWSDFMHCFFM